MVEGKMSPQLAYYHRKKEDPTFYDKEMMRKKNRYHNNEEVRKKYIENAKQRYLRLKEALKNQ